MSGSIRLEQVKRVRKARSSKRKMFFSSRQPNRSMRRLLALTIALWLGGLGCLSGCSLMMNPTAHAAELGAEEQACETALTKVAPAPSANTEHASCHRAKDAAPDAATASSSVKLAQQLSQTHTGTSRCPLVAPASDAARKPRIETERAVAAVSEWSPPVRQAASRVAQSSAGLWHPPRGDTHLRCCVFLI
jgi:hypothetical protein